METTLERFDVLVKRLQSTTSRNEKESILKEYVDDEDIKYILQFIYDPYIVTGISKKKASKYRDTVIDFTKYGPQINDDIVDFLNYFKIENTGRDIDLKFLECYTQLDRNIAYKDLIYGIITKDIKLGIQPTTLNKIFGKDFIRQFSCMLAMKYFDNPDKFLPQNTEFEITTKLDGVRCLCIYNEEMPKFYSRQGQLIEGLDDLMFEFRQMPDGHVFDGELLIVNDKNLDSKDLYRETMKVISKDGRKYNVIFNIFDILRYEDFINGICTTPAKERKAIIKRLLSKYNYKYIKNVDILYEGTDQSQIKYWLDKITSEGGEGIMLNIADAPYETKRTKNLLKVKKFNECEAYVVDLEEGTGKYAGKLGNLVLNIKRDNKFYEVKCGTGLSDEERNLYWNNKDIVLNKVVDIKYFEISNNQNNDNISLRFPTWMGRIRVDKDLESMSEV